MDSSEKINKPTHELPEKEKSAETRRDWEVIQENVGVDKTERLKIKGGWLYRSSSSNGAIALVFVPGSDK